LLIAPTTTLRGGLLALLVDQEPPAPQPHLRAGRLDPRYLVRFAPLPSFHHLTDGGPTIEVTVIRGEVKSRENEVQGTRPFSRLTLLMGRIARFLPENDDGVLVEVTGRVIGGRAMLVPAPNPRLFNEVVVGVMGRALEVSPLELAAAVWTSNHYLCSAEHK